MIRPIKGVFLAGECSRLASVYKINSQKVRPYFMEDYRYSGTRSTKQGDCSEFNNPPSDSG
jgi:hypothetical protein